MLYCNDCKMNGCIYCEKEHNNHNTISLGKIIPDDNKLEENKKNLRLIIDKCKEDIQQIINRLINEIINIESYYDLYKNIIDVY